MTDHREVQRIEAVLRRWFEREVSAATMAGELYVGVASAFHRYKARGGGALVEEVAAGEDVKIMSLSELARALADEKVMA